MRTGKLNKRSVGTEYEEKACNYLEQQGMEILDRNYRVRIGEIDIIARDGKVLVFAEVKFRSSVAYGGAEYAINVQKQRKIFRVAQWYMSSHKINENTICRFDAVLIDGEQVTHIKNAWQA